MRGYFLNTILVEVFRWKVLPDVQRKERLMLWKQERDSESEELGKRISRHTSLKASFKGSSSSILGCWSIKKGEVEEKLRYILVLVCRPFIVVVVSTVDGLLCHMAI
jgi:hypothetical protein